jgi:hypothetical protein
MGSQHYCTWISNQLNYLLSEAMFEQLGLFTQRKGQPILGYHVE